MKAKLYCILLLTILCLSAHAAAAVPRVMDLALLLSAEETADLEMQAEAFIAENGHDIVLVTTDDTGGKSSTRYADDLYEKYAFGTGTDLSGVLLLIDMDNRESYVMTSGAMIDILNDARIEALQDKQSAHLSNARYHAAFSVSVEAIAAYIKAGPVKGQHRYASDRIDPFSPGWLLASVGTAFIVSLAALAIVLARYKKRYNPVSYAYRQETSLTVTHQSDTLIGTVTTRTRQSSGSSGGGGGSSSGRSTTHRTSSGRTHGGGGRKF